MVALSIMVIGKQSAKYKVFRTTKICIITYLNSTRSLYQYSVDSAGRFISHCTQSSQVTPTPSF